MHRSSKFSFRPWSLLLAVTLALGGGLGQSSAGQSSPVPEGGSVEKTTDGFRFTEGPLWYQGRLLFTDIPANTVYQWTPAGSTRVFLRPSGHANGLAVSPEGDLLLAQHDGQVVRLAAESMIAPLAQSYDGKHLNSPNDLTVADDGTIYFTDPPYGVDEENRELDFSGVYRLDPDGALTLLSKEFSRPNGIVLSPDESTLYVNDTDGDIIRAYEVTGEGGITDGHTFAEMEGKEPGNADGMTVDAEGNLYTTGPGGIWIYSPSGDRLDHISVPKAPTNVAFGGPGHTTLYVTAQDNVYRVSLSVSGTK
jgi:gluconolactonase